MNKMPLIRFGIALALELIFFSALNFFDDWTLESMPVKFVTAAFLSGAAYLAAVSNFKIDISAKKQAILFWSAAIVMRLIALPLAPGDELTRNEWEGKIQRAGFNPYLIAPADSKLDELRHNFPQAAKINHPELRALDPPGAEFIFKVLSGISDRPIFYKILFALGDLCVAALLLRLIGGEDRYQTASWYAWNPLVAYIFAGAAHSDSLMMVAMLAGVLAVVRSTSATETRQQWLWALLAALLLGVAISLNLFAAFALLVCVFALRMRAIALLLTPLVPALLSLPFDSNQVWQSLGEINQLPRLNDLFWWIVEAIQPNPHQRVFHYYPILIACAIAVSLLFVRNWKRGLLWTFGTVLLLSPVLHAWYCVWILPIAVWRRAYAWCVLAITLFSYYLFWDERLFALPWHSEPWMRGLIIAPVLAAMIMLAAQNRLERAAG